MQQFLMMRTFYCCFVLLVFIGCRTSPQLSDTYTPSHLADTYAPPQLTAEDSVYADIFLPWEGRWEGTFRIYTDPQGQRSGMVQPRINQRNVLDSLGLKKTSEIYVKQQYESISPFVQKVTIEDTYPQSDGSSSIVISTGYNAIENGKILCVVQKPDEQVIHKGSSMGNQVLIWERSIIKPKKIEYFYEQVQGDTYYILGWGYYGDDDPTRSPRMWFYGEYHRPK